MFEMEFLEMMPHEITVQSQTYADGNYTPTGDVRRYRGSVSGKGISLRRPDSEDDTVIFDIHLGVRIEDDGSYRPIGDDVFTVHDLVTLPPGAAFLDTTPIIFAITRPIDSDGFHHVKIQLGWMYHRQTASN